MAKLTKGARAKIPTSKFAGPNRSYPINDADHARAAIMDSKGNPTIIARAKAALARFNGK